MIKFLHAADVHLDSPLRGLEAYEGAPAQRIRDATRRAFENLVDLAIREKVAFLLLAGDLYDGDWQDYNTGLYLVRQMGRLREAGIPVFAIAGNHDAQSKMTRRLPLPENVRMLATDEPQSHILEHLGIAIHGQGFATQAVTDDLSKRYPRAVKDFYNIGLLHTCATGADGHDNYAPCTTQGLISKEYDYWALGHIHLRQTLAETPFIAFPGNLQGRHARETGPKGALLVTLGKDRKASVEFHRLDVVRWESIEIASPESTHEDQIADLAASMIDPILADEDDARLVAARVVVKGPSKAHERLLAGPERLAAAVRARANDLGVDRLWIEQVKIKTLPMRTTPTIGDGPIEELFSLLDEYRSDAARLETAGQALADLKQKLPAEASDGPDAPQLDDPEWLRGILDAAEAILRERLHV